MNIIGKLGEAEINLLIYLQSYFKIKMGRILFMATLIIFNTLEKNKKGWK